MSSVVNEHMGHWDVQQGCQLLDALLDIFIVRRASDKYYGDTIPAVSIHTSAAGTKDQVPVHNRGGLRTL